MANVSVSSGNGGTTNGGTGGGTKTYKLEDVRPYWLYDTVDVTNGDTEDYFFQSPESKTTVETNLKQFSTIQIGWVFDVTRIRLLPRPSLSVADAGTIFENSIITYLKEGDIEIFSFPSLLLNAGAGVTGATTVGTTSMVTLGWPTLSAVMKLPFPLTLTGGKTFVFRMKWDSAVAYTNATPGYFNSIWMILEGILRREVVGA